MGVIMNGLRWFEDRGELIAVADDTERMLCVTCRGDFSPGRLGAVNTVLALFGIEERVDHAPDAEIGGTTPDGLEWRLFPGVPDVWQASRWHFFPAPGIRS